MCLNACFCSTLPHLNSRIMQQKQVFKCLVLQHNAPHITPRAPEKIGLYESHYVERVNRFETTIVVSKCSFKKSHIQFHLGLFKIQFQKYCKFSFTWDCICDFFETKHHFEIAFQSYELFQNVVQKCGARLKCSIKMSDNCILVLYFGARFETACD